MSQWTIMQPWWLLVAALALPLLLLNAGRSQQRLPGSWPRIVSPTIQGHLSRWVPIANHRQSRITLALLLLLLGLALADISTGITAKLPERALHGRVLVMDMNDHESFAAQLFTARQLVKRSPDIPTAIVATAADAYDVVPLTTDPDQLDRYLRVLSPGLMPDTGRRLHLGLERASVALQEAQIQAGQIVLLGTGGAPTEGSGFSPLTSTNSRWILLSEAPGPDWTLYADQLKANLLVADQLEQLDSTLLARRDKAVLASTPIDQRKRLTPWFVAACLPLWLLVFFRRRDL